MAIGRLHITLADSAGGNNKSDARLSVQSEHKHIMVNIIVSHRIDTH